MSMYLHAINNMLVSIGNCTLLLYNVLILHLYSVQGRVTVCRIYYVLLMLIIFKPHNIIILQNMMLNN